MSVRPVVLSIAGSDSGGGAGIQADLKTFGAFGCYGATAITAVTAQDTTGVHGVHVLPADFVAAQIGAVATDLAVAATKTGMLADTAIVLAVAAAVERHRLAPLVVDPVMVAASGDPLLEREAVTAVREHLLPLATLVTPNLDEAEQLVGGTVRTVGQMREAAEALGHLGPRAVLLKGGHLPGDPVDVLWEAGAITEYAAARIATARPFHGTGCTLSAAVACGLALGQPVEEAIQRARAYLLAALADAPAVGHGARPADHLVRLPD